MWEQSSRTPGSWSIHPININLALGNGQILFLMLDFWKWSLIASFLLCLRQGLWEAGRMAEFELIFVKETNKQNLGRRKELCLWWTQERDSHTESSTIHNIRDTQHGINLNVHRKGKGFKIFQPMDPGRISSSLDHAWRDRWHFRTIKTIQVEPLEQAPHHKPWVGIGWPFPIPGTGAVRNLGAASPLTSPLPPDTRGRGRRFGNNGLTLP